MDIVKFPECNVTYVKNQPGYLPLPAFKAEAEDGEVVSCWSLSFFERLEVLLTGRIWLSVLTFHKPLQPLWMTVNKPFKADA